MSDERISLELFGARVLTLTAELRDLQHRFTAMESRLTAMEVRLGAMSSASPYKKNVCRRCLPWSSGLPSGSTAELNKIRDGFPRGRCRLRGLGRRDRQQADLHRRPIRVARDGQTTGDRRLADAAEALR